MRQKPRAIELFAGAGIFGSAFQAAGFELTRAIELDKTAAQTYAQNLGDHIEQVDITKCKPAGSCDLIIAGPPCQGYSSLGKRDANDPRNKLSLEVVRFTRAHKPKVVVIENVARFLDSTQATKIAESFRRMGYEVETHRLNAYEFGVPQRRVRAILVASKIGMPRICKPRKKVRSVREAWRGLPKKPNGRNLHEHRVPSELALERMECIPAGGDKRDILELRPDLSPPSWQTTTTEVTDVWGRMVWNEPANTLRTCFLNPSKGRYIHPDQNRVITLREGARLHSIPDDYEFVGTPYQIARQIGNSVPYLLGKSIARGVRRLFT